MIFFAILWLFKNDEKKIVRYYFISSFCIKFNFYYISLTFHFICVPALDFSKIFNGSLHILIETYFLYFIFVLIVILASKEKIFFNSFFLKIL